MGRLRVCGRDSLVATTADTTSSRAESGPLPRLSIISPTYNQREYIDDAVASVAAQGDVVLEHIIIDGESNDGTREYLRELTTAPRSRHVRWISEPDHGQSDAINKGFQMATGEVVGWLNTDDFYLPKALTFVAEALSANPHVDVIYGEAEFVDARGEPIRVKRDHAFDYKVLLYYGCYIMSTATFIRRRVIDDGHLLDTSFVAAMDYEYFVRVANSGYRFGFLPRTLAAFRWHDSNASTLHSSRRRQERLLVQNRYGALGWIRNDRIRVMAYDALAEAFRARRVLRRAAEFSLGHRSQALLTGRVR